jgi:DNA-binding winged helix-turn-helix (wHTH) protein
MLDETQVSFLKKVSCVKFGYWTLLTQEQSINDGETNRTLEPLVFDLLLYFIIHSDRIISRQELIGNVWKQNYVDDNAINRAISELRKALKSEKQIGRIIKTHYRTGYSFMLPVELEYSADKLVSSEQEATTIKVNPSEYVTSRASSEASDNQPISQSQAVIAPLANKQPSTTQTYITQKKYQSWYSMVLLFLLVGSIAYLSYYSLKAEAPSVLANKQPLQPSPLSLSEEMLSWDEGSVGVVKLSKDKQLLAYSFDNLQEAEYSLHIKDLNTLKLYKIKSGSDYISPLAWSEEHTLVYQILNLVNAKCELWQVDLSKLELSNDHKKLFDCGATEIISAGIATIDNKLIYTKYNYRGRKNLSAIVNRSLNTGEEFQISSPNSELRGDYFVALADDQQKVAFFT